MSKYLQYILESADRLHKRFVVFALDPIGKNQGLG